MMTKSGQAALTLIETGADIYATDEEGMTALMLMWTSDSFEVAKVLIEAGAHVIATDKDGKTALMRTVNNRRIRSLYESHEDQPFMERLRSARAKMLIEAGANINAIDHEGRTALMRSLFTEVAKILIEDGADVDAKDNDGRTALMMAETVERAKLLIEAGADTDVVDKKGNTALIYAGERTVGCCLCDVEATILL